MVYPNLTFSLFALLRFLKFWLSTSMLLALALGQSNCVLERSSLWQNLQTPLVLMTIDQFACSVWFTVSGLRFNPNTGCTRWIPFGMMISLAVDLAAARPTSGVSLWIAFRILMCMMLLIPGWFLTLLKLSTRCREFLCWDWL